MKLTNTNLITINEAFDVLVSAKNDPKRLDHLLTYAGQLKGEDSRKIQSGDDSPRLDFVIHESPDGRSDMIMVRPTNLAEWALYHDLKLTPELAELIDYKPPNLDLANYMKSEKIERLIITLRRLDKNNGEAEEGTTGQTIIKENYPDMSQTMLVEALRVFRHILLN